MGDPGLKQRMRMAMAYHAELRNYAVVGIANKNEHGLGFFVKHGDWGVDVSPIVHLFKTQVYQLAKYLDVPEEIQKRTPTGWTTTVNPPPGLLSPTMRPTVFSLPPTRSP